METKLKVLLILVMLLFIIYIFRYIKKSKLSTKHALIWIVADIIVIICIAFIESLFNLTNYFGIEKVSNMMFFIGFIVVLVICFDLTNQLSLQNKKIISLVQELGILKNKLERDNNEDVCKK